MSVRHWRAVEADRGDALVGLGPGVGDVGADRGHGEDAAAGGDQGEPSLLGGAGVDDVDVGLVGQASRCRR